LAAYADLLGGHIEFRILGPLVIVRAGQDIQIGGAKARTVLAHLLLHARQLVTPTALIDELWREEPPVSATNTLQTYISHLRRLLEPSRQPGQEPQLLQTLPGGYRLDVQPQQLDSNLFEEAIRESRAALDAQEPNKAADRLRMGLELWHGPALADVQGLTAEREASRLEELRHDALEMRIEADLALGRQAELIGELERLVSQHPWREQLTAHLMVALYRCQRQADALAVYRAARLRLVEELGVSPGPALQQLEERILRQDPDLDLTPTDNVSARRLNVVAPTSAEPPADDRTAADARPRNRRRWVVAAIAAAASIAGLVAVGQGSAPLAWWSDGRQPPGRDVRSPGVFNEFDLAVDPGVGYDLDIPRGKRPDWHTTNNPRSPDYGYLDFYRTTPKSPDGPQISGVDLTNTNDFNVIHLVGPDDPPTICRLLSQQGGGRVKLADLRVGSKVCLRTHEQRWAMITVTRMPENPAAVLIIHVTVLST
jgi:DNA-binding SARP family transcriptional activator